VDNTTAQASSTPSSVVASLSNQGHPADWLIGEFDLRGAPRWGPTGQSKMVVGHFPAAAFHENRYKDTRAACRKVTLPPVVTTIGQRRPSVPAGYSTAVVLQNQDENRNVWSTVIWSAAVDSRARPPPVTLFSPGYYRSSAVITAQSLVITSGLLSRFPMY
jgi:hypothetical protein